MTGPYGDELPDTLDLAAIAADDALLDQLAAGGARSAVTWDGAIEEPTPISDAVIWTDEPIRPPSGPPVKKSRSDASVDGAARLLALVVADADSDLAGAVERMRAAQLASGVLATPGITWSQAGDTATEGAPGITWSQVGDSPVDGAIPGLTWGRLARRTGTRGAAVLAALAVSVGGVAAASVVAGPGNPLYPVHKLFAGPNPVQEQAYAVARVSAALDEAQGALDAHKPGLAHGKLTVAKARLGDVVAGTDKDRLVARLDALTALVALATPTSGTVTDSPTPSQTDTQSPTPSESDGTTRPTDPTATTGVEPTGRPSGETTSSADPGKGDGKDHGKHGKDGKGDGNVGDLGRGSTGNGRDDRGGKVGSNKDATGGKGGAGKGGDTRDSQGRHRTVSHKKPPKAGSGGSGSHSGESSGGTSGGGSSGGDTSKNVSLQGQD